MYLEELTTHAARVNPTKIGPLLGSLFEIHDEVDLERDDEKGFMGIGNTTLRYHWLIRALTRDRFSIEERTRLYMPAIASASLGWLVEFASTVQGDYAPKEGRETSEADRPVTERAKGPLVERALSAIRAVASDRSLLSHRDMMNILYRWRDFKDGNPSEVRTWTDGLMADDNTLIVLVRRMTTQSWSMGIGGFGSLGDRVATPTTRAQISDDIIDVTKFRKNLERILSEPTMSPDSL